MDRSEILTATGQLFKDAEMWYTHSLWSMYILSIETAYG
jgi:hypothetical protein